MIAAVTGSVKIDNLKQAGRIVKSGEPVYIGDTVSTDEKGALQILLLDETVFTIGPNSAIVIDKFIYDPATQSGQVNAKVVKGVFRFVTGKIARKKPSDMNVDLPSGTIGVRGTIVIGEAVGTKSTVVLLGPGAKTNTTHRVGQITVGNGTGSGFKQVLVTRPGFGSVIDGPDSDPTEPFEVPAEDLERMTSSLEPEVPADAAGEESGGPGEGSDPTEESGQDTAEAGESLDSESALNDLLSETGEETAKASQENLEEDAAGLSDGSTTVEDLGLVTQGVFNYTDSSVPLSGGAGDGEYDFNLDINFGDRSIGGSGVDNQILVTLPTSGHNATYPLSQKFFDEARGDSALFEYSVANTNTGGCSTCGTAEIDITLINAKGTVANNAVHSIEFADSLTPYEGAGFSEPRS